MTKWCGTCWPSTTSALIIDVRDNPGGLLNVVVDIAGHFIAHGVIVTTRGRTSRSSYEASGKNVYPPIPVVILVNGGSASASEILAGPARSRAGDAGRREDFRQGQRAGNGLAQR